MQFIRMNYYSSLIESKFLDIKVNNNKKNNFISFKINFIQQQKRFYNEDTNAAGVWDPYPGFNF